jgi:hypothetical protein
LSEYAERAARLQVENDRMRAENARLRDEAIRLAVLNRSLEARVTLLEAENERLRQFRDAVEGSRPWLAIQRVRAMIGRRW